ncbi:uncharacterized protein LOC131048412 [Cryptomeria japonica]|uniref:uncharacterized protein LOC131048412 n=1 Tax=Cryptomeria japonica TaxID=3369 RepID=UPI0027DA8299|nr:uncharacterized protein LOC131048412 [Cryptomeria japonica]
MGLIGYMISLSRCGVGLRLQCSRRQGNGFLRSDMTSHPIFSRSRLVFKWEQQSIQTSSPSPRRRTQSTFPLFKSTGLFCPSHLFQSLCLPFLLTMSRKSANNIVNNVGVAVQTDWNNRQANNSFNLNVRRMFEFVSQYDTVAKTKLTTLNDKLSSLERQMEVLEAQMTTVMTTSSQF